MIVAKTELRPTSPEAFVPDRCRGRVMLVTGAAKGSIGGTSDDASNISGAVYATDGGSTAY